jgi:hypothetical protein
MLAFSYHSYDGNNATISVTLDEHDCYVLPDLENTVIQRFVSETETTIIFSYKLSVKCSNVHNMLN